MIIDEFDICYGAAYKVVKHDLKNGKDLDNICSKEVLGKDMKMVCWNVDYNYKNPHQGPFLQ